MAVEVVERRSRIGINRDGQPVGYAVKVPRSGEWTAFVYTVEAPFDFARPGFESAASAAEFIGEHGQTPDHLLRQA